MRANAAQKATTHGEKTEVGAAPEVAAAAGLVEGVEDGKILGRIAGSPENVLVIFSIIGSKLPGSDNLV